MGTLVLPAPANPLFILKVNSGRESIWESLLQDTVSWSPYHVPPYVNGNDFLVYCGLLLEDIGLSLSHYAPNSNKNLQMSFFMALYNLQSFLSRNYITSEVTPIQLKASSKQKEHRL